MNPPFITSVALKPRASHLSQLRSCKPAPCSGSRRILTGRLNRGIQMKAELRQTCRGGAISPRPTASLMIQRRCLSELRGMKRNLRVALPDLKPFTEAVRAASDNLAVLHADRKTKLRAAHCCSDVTR